MKLDAATSAGDIPEGLVEPSLYVGKVTPGSLDDQVLGVPGAQAARAQWYVALAITLDRRRSSAWRFIGYTFYRASASGATTAPSSGPSTSSTSCSGWASATPAR